jgi:hypothetical protein
MNVPVADLAALVLIILLAVLVVRWLSEPEDCGEIDARGDVNCAKPQGHNGMHEGEWTVDGQSWGRLLWP